MEQEITIGIAISIVFAFLRYRISKMPKHCSEAGIFAGFLLFLVEVMVPQMKIPIVAASMFLVGMLLIGGSIDLWLSGLAANTKKTANPMSFPFDRTGAIEENGGIVTQGQNGDNSISK